MQCIKTFKKKPEHREEAPHEFPCRKCLPCRLNTAREKAIRVWHESRTQKDSIFLTLTYAPEKLKSPRLCYRDFQLFMHRLRKEITKNIQDADVKKEMRLSYMVTGEYGDENKRPHWHVILFNYRPDDAKKIRETELGYTVYTSKILEEVWSHGLIEFGEVTLDSANYVARYSAKKLTHGKDGDHDFEPIHRTSSKHAIGKKWIEKYWERTFSQGNVVLPNGKTTKIPRYYVDWLKENKPEQWRHYVMNKRQEIQEKSAARSRRDELYFLSELVNQKHGHPRPLMRKQVELVILQQKFKRLQEKLKL